MIVYFIYGAILRCPPYHANVRGPHYRVLQYVHDSLMVGCESDGSVNPSKWVVEYRILNAMVGFHDLNDL